MENSEKIREIKNLLKNMGITSKDVSIKKQSKFAISVGFKNPLLSTSQKDEIYRIANSYRSTDIENTTYVFVRDENTKTNYCPKSL